MVVTKLFGINIPKNVEFENKYKLVVIWEKKEEISEKSEVNILVKASQEFKKSGKG